MIIFSFIFLLIISVNYVVEKATSRNSPNVSCTRFHATYLSVGICNGELYIIHACYISRTITAQSLADASLLSFFIHPKPPTSRNHSKSSLIKKETTELYFRVAKKYALNIIVRYFALLLITFKNCEQKINTIAFGKKASIKNR